MNWKVNPEYEELSDFVKRLPEAFEQEGTTLFKKRNEIKVMEVQGIPLNVKSFKIPHLINKVAYAYLRGSKARHSYEYGMRMLGVGAHTPEPIAYVETLKNGLFYQSFYVSRQHEYDFTIRDLIGFEFPDKENILKEFARFTYERLHKNGIHHLDYSRGNILIKRKEKGYHFSVVDINRMRFEKMGYQKGLRNFSQIWASPEELEVVAREYARLNGREEEEAVRLLIQFDQEHKYKIQRKKRLKKWLKPF